MGASAAQRRCVAVVGSVNHDQFSYVEHLPGPGETVLASSVRDAVGGKGANQASAAAMLGARVFIVARVGADDAGESARRSLQESSVRTAFLLATPGEPSGRAQISVDGRGENTIVVAPGANAALAPGDVDRALDAVLRTESLGLVLAQAEVSSRVLEAAAGFCSRTATRFVLNLSPDREQSRDVLAGADPLVVNRGEAVALCRRAVATAEDIDTLDAEHLARLLSAVARSVVVTAGADGACVALAEGDSWREPAPPVAEVVDTTGAGDAFAGALVAALVAGRPLADAVAVGVAAGSYAVCSPGTTPSYPRGERWMAAIASTRSRR